MMVGFKRFGEVLGDAENREQTEQTVVSRVREFISRLDNRANDEITHLPFRSYATLFADSAVSLLCMLQSIHVHEFVKGCHCRLPSIVARLPWLKGCNETYAQLERACRSAPCSQMHGAPGGVRLWQPLMPATLARSAARPHPQQHLQRTPELWPPAWKLLRRQSTSLLRAACSPL